MSVCLAAAAHLTLDLIAELGQDRARGVAGIATSTTPIARAA
ncbi:hypothetical protein [Variovorax sp. PBS-H4]|nr:hypothetical protein [Variovorax sp. PBS-H4]